nr:hypothetical protein [Paenibacillus sp. PL91]
MLGVAILGFWSIEYVLFIDVLGALIANTALLLVHIPQPQRQAEDTAGQGMWKEIRYGIKELTKSRSLLVVTLAIAAVTVIYVPVSPLFPLMMRNHFGGDALQAGSVEAAFAIGMLLGGLLLGTWGAKKKKAQSAAVLSCLVSV